MHIMKNCKLAALHLFWFSVLRCLCMYILYKPEILEFAVNVLRKDNGLKNLKNVLAEPHIEIHIHIRVQCTAYRQYNHTTLYIELLN
jgi:hypothetical protein